MQNLWLAYPTRNISRIKSEDEGKWCESKKLFRLVVTGERSDTASHCSCDRWNPPLILFGSQMFLTEDPRTLSKPSATLSKPSATLRPRLNRTFWQIHPQSVKAVLKQKYSSTTPVEINSNLKPLKHLRSAFLRAMRVFYSLVADSLQICCT